MISHGNQRRSLYIVARKGNLESMQEGKAGWASRSRGRGRGRRPLRRRESGSYRNTSAGMPSVYIQLSEIIISIRVSLYMYSYVSGTPWTPALSQGRHRNSWTVGKVVPNPSHALRSWSETCSDFHSLQEQFRYLSLKLIKCCTSEENCTTGTMYPSCTFFQDWENVT
jgi:hypothetical protein